MFKTQLTDNVFAALAATLIRRGDDMELVAQELAQALREVIAEGKGVETQHEFNAEFERLLELKL